MSSLRTRRVEVALVAAFAIVVGAVILRHEMWRDELQAWLIAQASNTPRELLHNTRYEGHPILWYALLWPFAHVSHSPRLEQTIEWLLAVGGVAIVVLRAPFSRVQKALYGLGYFVVFEYGVLARSYTLGMLLLLGAVAVAATSRSDGTRRWSAIGILLAACAFTSAFGTLLAGAVLGGLLVDEWARGRSRRPIVIGALGGVAVAIAAYAQARPAPGTSSLAEWHTDVNVHRAAGALAAVSRALLPIPKVQHAFWNTSVTDGSTTIAALLSVVAILAVAWALRRTTGALVTWVVGNVAVVVFSYLKLDEFSTMRYLGHLFVLLVAVLWLRTSMHARPAVDDARDLRFVAIGFTAILALQAVVGVYAISRDLDGRFSDAKAAAAYLDEHYDSRDTIIADPDFAGSALSAYLDRPLTYVQGNRTGTFVLWDARRLRENNGWTTFPPGRHVVFVSNTPQPGSGRLLASFTDGIVEDEHYWIYALISN